MASGLYVAAKTALMTAQLDLTSVDVRFVLVDTADYTVNLTTHDALDDIPSGARVATSGALDNKTVVAGVFNADDETLANVSGDQAEALVLYKHTGTESTSLLIAYIDSGTNIPVTPNGNDITSQWNASGIFGL